jgi:hypothetical protein
METAGKLPFKDFRRDIPKEHDNLNTSPEGILTIHTGSQDYEAHHSIPKYEDLLLPLLVPIRENLRSGKYGIILGEDTSARLCTLVVGELAKKMAKTAKVKVPEIKFYAGMRDYDAGEIYNLSVQLKKWKEEVDSNNILYVSDSIGRNAGSLKNFLEAAKIADLKVDVIVVENFGYDFNLRKKVGEDLLRKTVEYIAVGPLVGDLDDRQTEPVIFKDIYLNATTKKYDLARKKSHKSKHINNSIFSYPFKDVNPKIVKTTREIANVVAENLFLEIGPSLIDLFETINIPYEVVQEMTEGERLKLCDWIKRIEVRIMGDPRISIKKGEVGFIKYDSLQSIRYRILSVENKDSFLRHSGEYKKLLNELKVFLIELDKRDYTKKTSPAVEPL